MSDRFERPRPGPATAIRFPPITRGRLANGLEVWAIVHHASLVVTIGLLVPRGTADDRSGRQGIASLTGDLLDEGAGERNAIEIADAFSQLGTHLDTDVGPDTTTFSVSALSRYLGPALALMADVLRRPHLAEPDFQRVRELRVNRLRQLSRSPGTAADRAYVSAVFPTHAYGHGALGTTASLAAASVDEVREFWSRMFGPDDARLIVVGDVEPDEAMRQAERHFGPWEPRPLAPRATTPDPASDARVLLVDRPGAPQSELRVGHIGPPRAVAEYHALVTLNAVLGGQFTSRINQRLREEKGITYGAHTAFDFRRVAGTLSCETSVQADATAEAVADILAEFEAIGRTPTPDDELARAKASLTRGYVRHFETAAQLGRAAMQLATYGLDDGTFDRFVPTVEALDSEHLQDVAREFIRPKDATIVVVGDASVCRAPLEALGRPLSLTAPEF
jgi:zinc protease